MAKTAAPRLGAKVRTLRRREGLTQKQLAEQLQISPSYLNLIEHNRRPLSAQVLIRLAQLFKLDLAAFAEDDGARLVADLMEVMGDPLFEERQLTQQDVKELVEQHPQLARSMLDLYGAYRGAQEHKGATTEAPRGSTEEVSEFIQRHDNFFPEVEEIAERFRHDADVTDTDRYAAMVRWLQRVRGIEVDIVPYVPSNQTMRHFDGKRLSLSELLRPRSRHFQVAHQIGLLLGSELYDRLINDDRLTSRESRVLARVALANYFAGAVLMPYRDFLRSAKGHRYDVELLGHRYRASFEQVCHRLTTLRRPGAEGLRFHLIRVDIAGNISKRYSGSGIRFARYSGACPRWNVHAAFLTPGMIRTQVSEMPDGTTFFCFARTVSRGEGGYHGSRAIQAIGVGCKVEDADKLVYADGVDLSSPHATVPVGVTCRLCHRLDCTQRAFPPIDHPVQVDENHRGMNFFAPAGLKRRTDG